MKHILQRRREVFIIVLGLALLSLGFSCRAADSPLFAQGKRLLAADNPIKQARGVAMLGFCPGTETIMLLRPVFKTNDFSIVRGAAAVALGQLHDPAILTDLVNAVQHADSGIQSYAVEGLGELGDVKAVPSLMALLHDKATPASLHADIAAALGKLHDKDALPDLLPLLQDPDPNTQIAVLHVLSSFRDPRALDAIAALLVNRNESVRAAAAYALGFIPGDDTVDLLLAYVKMEKADSPLPAAIHALARLHATQALPQLLGLLQDDLAANHGNFDKRGWAIINSLASTSFGPALAEELCALFR